jgi:hypothetical protein
MAATATAALYTWIVESQKPDVLPDWMSFASLALLITVGVVSLRIVRRADPDPSAISALVLGCIVFFALLWSVLEVVI